MLNTASDYRFVDTSNVANFINGEIMPVVFPEKNTMAFVRFNDYLFLLEGFYERMNPESAGLNNVMPSSRTIYAANIIATEARYSSSSLGFYGASIGYSSSTSYYINPNSVVPISAKKFDTSSFNILGDFITDYQIQSAVQTTNLKPPSSRKTPLMSEYIRARYYDLNRQKRLYITISLGDVFSDGTYIRYNRDGSVSSTSPFNLTSRALNLFYQTSIYNNSNYLAYTTRHTYKDSFFKMPFAKSAKFVYSTTINKQQSGSLTQKYIADSIDIDVINGDVTVPNSLLDDIRQTAINESDWSPISTEYGIDIYLNEMHLIVDFEFPASLDGINWNWTP